MEKSLLQIGSSLLLEQVVKLLSNIFEELVLVTSKEEVKTHFPDLCIIEDRYKNCGPLGGIHAALEATNKEAIFIVACDMPRLNKSIICKQVEMYLKNKPDVLVPRHIEGLEPLHAVYSRNCLSVIEKQLKNNIYSIRKFYDAVELKYFETERVLIKHFYNINTQHDLKKVIEENTI